jgi:hypothetical protein
MGLCPEILQKSSNVLSANRKIKPTIWQDENATSVTLQPQDISIKTSFDKVEIDIKDTLGFLDYTESSITNSMKAQEVLRFLVEALQGMNKNTEKATTDLNSLNGNDLHKLAQFKKITNRQADNMENFVSRMTPELPILEKAILTSMDSYNNMLLLTPDMNLNAEDSSMISAALQAVSNLKNEIMDSTTSFAELKNTIHNLPKMTIQFNRAKRNLVEFLQEFININNRSLLVIQKVEQAGKRIQS